MKLPELKKINEDKPIKGRKKKILLLSDDIRMFSGIASQGKELVINTVHKYDWVQIAGSIKHPDKGKIMDLSQEAARETGVTDAKVILYPTDGYGNADLLREIITREQPDAILHFTDPRFWEWLYQIQAELQANGIPLIYLSIWDDGPDASWNTPFYGSCDLIMSISKQTFGMTYRLLKKDEYNVKIIGENNEILTPEEAGIKWGGKDPFINK